MANISKITLPNGSTYDIKDTTARNQVTAEATARQNADTTLTNQINTLKSNLTGAMHYAGVTTTPIRDGISVDASNTTDKSITINNTTYVPKPGDVVIYENKEFVYWETTSGEGTIKVTKGHWNEFGSTGSLKALAFKDSASGTTTPTGTVSKPTFTGTEGTVTIVVDKQTFSNCYTNELISNVSKYDTVNNKWGDVYASTENDVSAVVKPTTHVSGGNVALTKRSLNSSFVSSVGTLPTFSASVANETLSFNFNTGTLPKADTVSVLSDVNSTYTNPTVEVSPFSITGKIGTSDMTITGKFTPQGTISQPTFTGNAATVTVK